MGIYLSSPNKEKISHDGGDDFVSHIAINAIHFWVPIFASFRTI
jgi:hypothetical protein